MSELEAFLNRVRSLLTSLEGTLNPSEISEVEHLMDHDEIGEALRTLAWIIVEEDKRVPFETIASIRELSRGLVDEADMPPGLDEHGK